MRIMLYNKVNKKAMKVVLIIGYGINKEKVQESRLIWMVKDAF